MTEEAIKASGKVSGKMFLYRDPQLLAPETHGTMGFSPAERPFDFVRDERVIPLTIGEFSSAQRYYPIIFSNLEKPLPAVVGLLDEKNLFVDGDGNWDPLCYLPNYLRCYPFAFAHEGEGGRVAVVVDMAADSVSDSPQYPFFKGDKVSEHAEALMQLCAQYDVDRRRTVDFCQKLRELDLLTPIGASYTPAGSEEPEPLAEYIGINVEKFNELSKDQVYELHQAGFLSAAYLQLYSLENWRHLMARRETLR